MSEQFNRKGLEKYYNAKERGAALDSEREIIGILQGQDCVNYSNEKYSVTFDLSDIEKEG